MMEGIIALYIHNIVLLPTRINIPEYIEEQAITYNVDVDTALRIAKCESNFDPYAKNKYSSAKGIYQFIDSTWDGYCEGDVYNFKDNIKCFMELYPKHKSWWECK